MQRSIATAPDPAAAAMGVRRSLTDRIEAFLDSLDPAYIGLFFFTVALGIYLFSDPTRNGFYNHFVWQADAFLDGRFAISYPVSGGAFTNAYFQDVMPVAPGLGLLPFPPLPAVVLLPLVAVFGLATDAQLVGVVIGALNVALAWRMSTRLTRRRSAAALATIFFGFGTVHWYAAMLSSTWFLAHLVAMFFVLLALTMALDAERLERWRAALHHSRSTPARSLMGPLLATFEESSVIARWLGKLRPFVDGRQFMVGFVFGLAGLARLTVLFGAPFFVFVGGGGSLRRRAFSAGLGALIPVLLLLAYNLLATGHPFNPAYDFLYQTEYLDYMPHGLEINTSYGIEDIRHIPLNLLIMLGWPPVIDPSCGLALLNPDCPPIRPDQIGMSVLLTSPAYLLAVPLVLRRWRCRIVLGSALAVLAIAFVNLMHFSQGWVQFGYRFSNDFAPFALILVTLAIARRGPTRLNVGLVLLSVAINAWGVYWGVRLGW